MALPGGLRRARIRPYRVDPHALALRDPGLTGSYAIATTLADLTSHEHGVAPGTRAMAEPAGRSDDERRPGRDGGARGGPVAPEK